MGYFRLTEAEYRELEALSRRDAVPQSHVVRVALQRYFEERRLA